MSAFEYLSVLISIILALGMTLASAKCCRRGSTAEFIGSTSFGL